MHLHYAPKLKCLQLWKLPLNEISIHKNKSLAEYQKRFIQEHCRQNPTQLEQTTVTPAPQQQVQPTTPTDQAITPDTNEPTPDPACLPSPPPAKKQRTVNLTRYVITSNQQESVHEIPNSHRLVTANYLAGLQNDRARLQSLKDSFSKKKFVTDADPLTKSLFATAMAATPALASKAAAYTIPLVVGAFLNQHDLLPNIDKSTYSQAFPSESYLRGLTINQAAENMVSLTEELKGKQVFLSCDKGTYH